MITWKRMVLIAVLLGAAAVAGAQVEPDPVQIYRTIKFTSDERAGDVRWIEIWETRADDDWQWVMVDLQGTDDGVETTCYHAVALGGGAPVYFVDDELVPVDSAATLRSEIENRRLVDQSLFYVRDYDANFDQIEVSGTETIAGIESEQRTLIDEDAANLFLIKPPATSTAAVWTATNGGYVTRYRFTADGSTGDVSHTYDLIPGGSIEPPASVNMQCFEGGFPLPDAASPLVTGSLTHSTFTFEGTTQQMIDYYNEALTPGWEPADNTSQGGRIFTRTLDTGSVCRLGLEFRENPNGGTVMTARVVPDVVTAAAFDDLPDDLETVSVVQNAFTVELAGTVLEGVEQVAPDLEAEGWVQRPELTDIRDDSAFVTLTKDGLDTHIIVDGSGASATVQVQQRDPVCGPTFAVP